MKKIISLNCFICLIVGVFLLFFANQSMATTFCVSDETNLIAALNEAKANGSDDDIKIQQGTYNGNFVYASTESFGVTIKGGFGAGCTARVLDPANTVLDAEGFGSVLSFSTPGVNADIEVSGLTLQNSGFHGSNGFGLYVRTKGIVNLTKNTIRNNAGSLYINDADIVTLTNNIITSGSNYGVQIEDAGTVTLTNNNISDNSGATYGAGAFIHKVNTVTLTGNSINNNKSSVGGGVNVTYVDTITLTNNSISNNKASNRAGGITVSANVSFTMINNTISNNIVTRLSGDHGGVAIELRSDSVFANIYNNIIWNNYSVNTPRNLTIYNDIDGNSISSTVNLYNNDFDQSANGTYIQLPFPIDPSNLNNADPLFVDPNNDDFHLTKDSPCIDAGTSQNAPSTDIDGDPRPKGFGYDIGADEFGFTDVLPGSNHEASIYAIYYTGITTGCSQNPLRFCSQDPVTRAQMAAFIIRALEGEPPSDYCDTGSPFPDVDPNLKVCKYIKRLSELEITTGYPDGTYRPYNNVTRAQMAAFIVRAKEGEPPTDYCGTGSPFPDVDPNSPTCKYIKRFFELGITTGYSDGTYRPSNTVIRRQMAAFLDRAFLKMD